ncbi:MAG TPA: hypothetical protein VIX89_20180 [Bryobacteraceae bacterium]
MPSDIDRFQQYYSDKIWNLIPAIYRTLDSTGVDQSGPLRELVNRIGAQAAVVRRGIDRLWEDQSIETCDDWVIPYIADLLATNLVASLDARGQRLDTAKTVYYRRRKGTVAILEEIASDITGWDVKVVEFFRRMGRTRHSLDPAIGPTEGSEFPDPLQKAEGLVGAVTKTGIGGWADLRNAYGASKAHSAFDEFFHMADFRRGEGMVGWHNIPRLGVFAWRLLSFGVTQTTAVKVKDCDGHFTFDPTGRPIPLFAAAARTKKANFGDNWVSPEEFQLPGAISQFLMNAHGPELYPSVAGGDLKSVGVYRVGTGYELIPAEKLKIFPEVGRFQITDKTVTGPFFGTYHYGFASEIGAGPYDRRVLGEQLSPMPTPVANVTGGVNLAVTSPVGTTIIGDSLTYTKVNNISGIANVTVKAANKSRPLLRLSTPWTINGAQGSELYLEGLFVSGRDIVLTGNFDTVALICCTLDPGNSDPAATPPFALALDGKALAPVRLLIKGRIRNMTIERSIVSAIRAVSGGSVDHMTISGSIVQAIPDGGPSDNAIEEGTGVVNLTRSTVLGKISVHQLHASECILDDVATVVNPQDGCVRFTAWSTGSVLPRRYESVEIAPGAPIFTSRVFGRPGYAQLLATADQARISGANSIGQGAQNGSEMGAFAREQNAIKERSLLIKYQEFMPLGLVPVVVYVS